MVPKPVVSQSPEYKAWRHAIERCASHPNYAGRGIAVCDRWRESFATFLADVGPRPGPGYQLDRIDNDRGYEPGNVRWTTAKENVRNRRTTRRVMFRGALVPLAEVVEATGINYHTMIARLESGMTADEAAAKPVVYRSRRAPAKRPAIAPSPRRGRAAA